MISNYHYEEYACPLHGKYEYASIDGGHVCPDCEDVQIKTGARFDGFKKTKHGQLEQYTDIETGTTFYRMEGEPLDQAVQWVRAKFEGEKA